MPTPYLLIEMESTVNHILEFARFLNMSENKSLANIKRFRTSQTIKLGLADHALLWEKRHHTTIPILIIIRKLQDKTTTVDSRLQLSRIPACLEKKLRSLF